MQTTQMAGLAMDPQATQRRQISIRHSRHRTRRPRGSTRLHF